MKNFKLIQKLKEVHGKHPHSHPYFLLLTSAAFALSHTHLSICSMLFLMPFKVSCTSLITPLRRYTGLSLTKIHYLSLFKVKCTYCEINESKWHGSDKWTYLCNTNRYQDTQNIITTLESCLILFPTSILHSLTILIWLFSPQISLACSLTSYKWKHMALLCKATSSY